MPVLYTPAAGAADTITGIFHQQYVLVDAGMAGVSSKGPAVFLVAADLPAGADLSGNADRLTIGANTYKLREAKPDGDGGLLLLLHKV